MNCKTIALSGLLVYALDGLADNHTNFIIINCDDMGYGDLGCYGHPTILTPNLDRMASEGQKWTSFYVSSSVSSPSRAGLLTGRLGVRTGMYGNQKGVLFPNSPKGLPENEKTIASLLKEANYVTACVGKWHVGHKAESMPLQKGFDYYYGIPYSNDMSRKEQILMGNTSYPYELPFYDQENIIEKEPDQTQLTQRLTEYAVSFIGQQKKKPFFLYLAHPMPHVPLYSSEKFSGKSLRGKYGDAVEEIDWSVGLIMEALAKNKLQDNTVVIFTSDNGPWLPYGIEGGSAGLLKDGKGSTFEGGFRVPCIVWGKNIASHVVTEMASTLDLLPTFCDIAGVELPKDRTYDGISLKKVWEGSENNKREFYPFFSGNRLFAYRKGNYKIHFMAQPTYGQTKEEVYDKPKLYDLGKDPGELYDIASQYSDIVKELKKEAENYLSGIQIQNGLFDLPGENTK